jgi:hypothetical protein
MQLSDEYGGFRILPNGEVEVITVAEARALIKRTLWESRKRQFSPNGRRLPTLH